MSVKGENYNRLAKLFSNHFLTANKKLCRKSLAESQNGSKFKTTVKNKNCLKYL